MSASAKQYELGQNARNRWPPLRILQDFWNGVSDILISSFNYSYETGTLSVSQRRGIVKLIPKKDADLSLIKNWRPLTLLNCDYKIATKAIASRIKLFFPKRISDDQVLLRIDLLVKISF